MASSGVARTVPKLFKEEQMEKCFSIHPYPILFRSLPKVVPEKINTASPFEPPSFRIWMEHETQLNAPSLVIPETKEEAISGGESDGVKESINPFQEPKWKTRTDPAVNYPGCSKP